MKKVKSIVSLIIIILSVSISLPLIYTPSVFATPLCSSSIIKEKGGDCKNENGQECYKSGVYSACKAEGPLNLKYCYYTKLTPDPRSNEDEDQQKIHDFCEGYTEVETDQKNSDDTPSNDDVYPTTPTTPSSDNPSNPNNGGSTPSSGSLFDGGDCDQSFLGLTPWSCGVKIEDEESLKSGIWQIVANIATDLTIIAAYLVIIYVIYGGYLYILSNGDSNKLIYGKRTLTNAFIGLAIVMTAYLILNSIRIVLLGANNAFSNCATEECVTAGSMFIYAIQWVIGIAGVVAVIFIIYGGISYSTSGGEPSKLQKAKQTILYALIGLAIIALAELITAFVSNIIRNATNDSATSTSYINQTTISKEVNENQTN